MKKIINWIKKNIFKRFNKKAKLPIQSQVIPKEQSKPNSKSIDKTIEDVKPIVINEQSIAEELRLLTSESIEKENVKNNEDYNKILKLL